MLRHPPIPTLFPYTTLFRSAVTSLLEAADDLDPDSEFPPQTFGEQDRKSTRLNSSHLGISYAVFCLKKKIQQRSLRGATGCNGEKNHSNNDDEHGGR